MSLITEHNAIIQNKVFDRANLIDQFNCVLKYIDYPQRKILLDCYIDNINNYYFFSHIIPVIIIEIMKILEIPLQTQNMLLSLIPNHFDILLKILSNLDYNNYEDIDFLFNNYNYLLNKNIELIQSKFLLNHDVIIEIRKVLIKQAIKEDYRTLQFNPDYLLTDDIILFAVKSNYIALQFVPDYKLTEPTIIIEIMKILEIPLQTQNMLLSLIPDYCDILLKILRKLDCNSCEDINFLFNNYNYLLNKNIELIQSKFLLNHDVIIEIRKVLIKQAIKEDYRTLQFNPDYLLTDDIILFAVKSNCRALQFVPDYKLTDELIIFAVKIDGFSLLFLQEEKITEEIIKLAIKTVAIKNVKFSSVSDLFELISEVKITDEIIKLAIKESQSPYDTNLFQYIQKNKITDEIIKLAIKKEFMFSDLFDYIPEDKITNEIIDLAHLYGYN